MSDSEVIIIDKDITRVKALFKKLNGAVVEAGILTGETNPLTQIAYLNEMGGKRDLSENDRSKMRKQMYGLEKKGQITEEERSEKVNEINELPSTINLPSRSTLRTSFDNNENLISIATEKTYDDVLTGKVEFHSAFQKLRNLCRKLIRDEFINGNLKENSDITKTLKGNTKPLRSARDVLFSRIKSRYKPANGGWLK